eukprot:jgi/Mesvir1/12338/Mv00524-RA.1
MAGITETVPAVCLTAEEAGRIEAELEKDEVRLMQLEATVFEYQEHLRQLEKSEDGKHWLAPSLNTPAGTAELITRLHQRVAAPEFLDKLAHARSHAQEVEASAPHPPALAASILVNTDPSDDGTGKPPPTALDLSNSSWWTMVGLAPAPSPAPEVMSSPHPESPSQFHPIPVPAATTAAVATPEGMAAREAGTGETAAAGAVPSETGEEAAAREAPHDDAENENPPPSHLPAHIPLEGEYVFVDHADVVDSIACFVASYLTRLPETKHLTPEKLQKVLLVSLNELKGRSVVRRLWDWGQYLHHSAWWTTSAVTVYKHPLVAKAAVMAIWTVCKLIVTGGAGAITTALPIVANLLA